MSLATAAKGDGIHIVDSEGKRYLDASGGAAVSCLGHSHPKVIEAIKRQLDDIAYCHSGFFTSTAMEELAEYLVVRSPGMLRYGKVYFVSGGSEAMEASLKMARQYFLEIDQPQRRHIIARRQSYHGNTLGALATGGNVWRRTPFEPLLPEVHHISPCYAYRDCRNDETEEEYGRRVADELETAILELGSDTVMAFVAEPVVGATMGAVPAVDGYFKRVRQICDRYGILLILDEVMCGMGRTGTLFASEQEGIVPDIVLTAKGLGAGYQPIGAVLCTDAIYNSIVEGTGFFQHGHTYMGHATACAGALAVQKVIDEEGLLAEVRRLGGILDHALNDRLGNHSHVGNIRGRGLFKGIELVRDRSEKEPFNPDIKLHARVKSEAMARGLMCYPMGGTIDGKFGDHILIAPPFIVNEQDIGDAVEILANSIEAAIKSA